METPAAACEIDRLPEELLVHVISLTTPVAACCAAAVSRAFRAAADSDEVWSRFLPRDLPRFAKKELPKITPPSKKWLFLRLSDQPVLLPRKFIRMNLDKATGAKCFALSASTLRFPRVGSWKWSLIHLGSDHRSTRAKRFSQAVEFSWLRDLEIAGKMDRKLLSPNSTYAAYLVFKEAMEKYEFVGWDVQFEEASVAIGGRQSTRRVCLRGYVEDDGGNSNTTLDDDRQVPRRHVMLKCCWEKEPRAVYDLAEDVVVSRRRADGWMEVELGEFCNEGGVDDDGEVSVSLRATTPDNIISGLIVRTIEIRTKQMSSLTSLYIS